MIGWFNWLFISLLSLGFSPAKTAQNQIVSLSDKLILKKVGQQVYQHTSFLETKSFGKVACNGMIVYKNREAIIFNTTTDNATSLELINWVRRNLKCKIIAIIPTHFHEDCLGGLAAFHQHKIPSYANNLTINIARSKQLIVPENAFTDLLELKVSNKKVLTEFVGAGHTPDNVIGYFPEEKIMFGGCLIKEVGAGKGNLADADTMAWPQTVAKLKAKYPEAKLVIPGHGQPGGTALLDYTIKLFKQ